MFSLGASNSYYLCVGGCDLRKGFDTLSGVVRSGMSRDPLSGEVFIFINSSRSSMKLLHWESGGLVIYHKRLERGRFALPELDPQTGSYQLTWTDLVMMVEGISVDKIRYKKRLKKVPE
ncbi:transposase [Bacteroidia bacterium]|nr:transposase [Bacteroidia bacterium]